MRNKMTLIKATLEHIPTLVQISKDAFDSDITVGAPSKGGPPEYDSVEWHIEMMKQGHLFTAVEGSTIVGGSILFRDKREASFMYVGRIFVKPDLFRKGYGTRIMEQIEAMDPVITTWCLDTPLWNQRTNCFYKKLGYVETSRDAEFIYYQKSIGR